MQKDIENWSNDSSEELEGFRCLFSEKGHWRINSTIVQQLPPLLQHLHVHSTSYNCVSIGLEQLIPYQGMVFKLFLHKTSTKSSDKSLLIDQASLTTLWCAGTSTTSLSYLYINEWRFEDMQILCFLLWTPLIVYQVFNQTIISL